MTKQKIGTSLTLLALFVIGLTSSYYSTQKYGIGLISDSCAYLKMAENFASSTQLICYPGYTYSLWPLLYPIILSVPIYLGIDTLQAARLVNMIAYGITLCLAYLCLLPFAITKLLRIATFLIVISFYPLYGESNFAMTDMLFICTCLLFTWLGQNYEANFKTVLGLALTVAVAWLLRYVGVTLCVTGLIIIFLYHTKPLKNKILASLYYLFFAIFPMIFWLTFNYFKNGHLYGERTWGNGHHIMENINIIIGYLSFQLLPFQLPVIWRNIGLLLFISILIYFIYSQKVTLHKKGQKLLSIYFIFSITYCLFLIVLSASASFVPMYIRYLSPISYFIIILVFTFLVYLTHFIAKIPSTALRKLAYFIAISSTSIWIFQHFRSTSQHIIARYEGGAGGFTTEQFINSDFQMWLNKQRFEGIIFTNVLHFAYTHLIYANSPTDTRLLLDKQRNFTTDFKNQKGKKIAFLFHGQNDEVKFDKNIPYKIIYSDDEVDVYEF